MEIRLENLGVVIGAYRVKAYISIVTNLLVQHEKVAAN